MTSELSQTLADIEVFDPAGESVRLGEFWSESPAVLVFIRHFG